MREVFREIVSGILKFPEFRVVASAFFFFLVPTVIFWFLMSL
jgi:hypothetical protein